jgi:DnaJ-class molecular chaperone
MNINAYNELNLNKGATESEIRAAFRKIAKEYHPDTSINGSVDVDKFRNAYRAYRELLGTIDQQNVKIVSVAPASPTKFVFTGQRNVGLDQYIDIALVKPMSSEFEIVLPYIAHEACPRCLGQGHTLGRLNPQSDLLRPQTCPKCQGRGSISHKKHLSVKVTADMILKGKFRLRGVGGYLPSQAKRGDLIVNLNFVDRLPSGH